LHWLLNKQIIGGGTHISENDDMRPVCLHWLISHKLTVLFSQNKSATSNQPEPASSTLLSEQTSINHQPTEQANGRLPS
jgi:hypothetical protein